jgi:hypothetical protein
MSLFASSVDYPVYLIEASYATSGSDAVLLSSLGSTFGESVAGGTPSNVLDGTSDDNGLLGVIASYLEANGATSVTDILGASPGVQAGVSPSPRVFAVLRCTA